MFNNEYKINNKLSEEDELVALTHQKKITNNNPAYLIPWSRRTEYPLLDTRNATYQREILDFDQDCQNLKIKLDKLYKVNKKNKILIQTIVLVFVTRYYGNSFQELERIFNYIKYFRFKRTGEVEVFEEKNFPMPFRIFLAYSYDYYKFHSENNFTRYGLFEDTIEPSVIFSLVPYTVDLKVNEISPLEQRLYKKFLDEYVLEEEK